MSLVMTLDCPHCKAANSSFSVAHRHVYSALGGGGVFHRYNLEVFGVCNGCHHGVVAAFRFDSSSAVSTGSIVGDLSKSIRPSKDHGTELLAQKLWQAPENLAPNIPEHLPDRVARSFLEADKAMMAGLWGLAAAGYRKAVDRAITPLLGKDAEGKMLGSKIGMLERLSLLPPAMLDWIRIVKDDGNFALHHDDADFDTKEEIDPAREFAFTLLTYLYTLPEKVRIARGIGAAEAIDPPQPDSDD